jgi:hypothetical protein
MGGCGVNAHPSTAIGGIAIVAPVPGVTIMLMGWVRSDGCWWYQGGLLDLSLVEMALKTMVVVFS